MKNIGILGFGTVGRATGKYLTAPNDRRIIPFDSNTAMETAVRRSMGVTNDPQPALDALIICISLLPLAGAAGPLNIAALTATELFEAMSSCDIRMLEGAPILVRTTVAPGTCDHLQKLMPNNPVLAWPEFSKEESMRRGWEIKPKMIGVPAYDEDKGTEGIECANILRFAEIGPEVMRDCEIWSNTQVEFFKLAWNVKRAMQVTTFNELVRGAIRLGIDPVTAEHLTERAEPAAPTFATMAFGGKCLRKDLHIWDTVADGDFGFNINAENKKGPRRALVMAQSASRRLGLPHRPWTVLGLQDGPSSDDTSNSPAMQLNGRIGMSGTRYVDSIKAVRDKFASLLLKFGTGAGAVVCEPSSHELLDTNMIIIAQKSHGSETWNALMNILKTSEEPVKVVVNGCHMQFNDFQIVQAMRYGAVFIDEAEHTRQMIEEYEAEQRAMQLEPASQEPLAAG